MQVRACGYVGACKKVKTNVREGCWDKEKALVFLLCVTGFCYYYVIT